MEVGQVFFEATHALGFVEELFVLLLFLFGIALPGLFVIAHGVQRKEKKPLP